MSPTVVISVERFRVNHGASATLVTLTFTLELLSIIAGGVVNLPTNIGVSETFRCRLMGQELSYAPRDFATLTFDPGDHGAC